MKLIPCLRFSLLAAMTFSATFSAFADDEEDAALAQTIEKIILAYGGEKLLSLSSYSIDDQFLSPTIGQGHRPDLVEVGESAQSLRVDIKANKSSYDTWSEGRSGGFQGATISDGKKAYSIDFSASTYGEANSPDVYTFAGGTLRTSDTILAYELNKAKDQVEMLDDQAYLNRPHHVLKMPFPNSPDLHLFVDSQSHLISKMVRTSPSAGELTYLYTGRDIVDGISTATRTSFYVAGELNLVSVKHKLLFNPQFPADAFDLPKGFKAQGERIDGSSMKVNTISKGVHHLGQNGGYSLFVNTSMGTVGVGGYAGLNQRFERYQKDSNNRKPLSYQVVTHHHSDHIGGLSEAVELGATLVTVDDNIQTIKDSLSDSSENANIVRVNSQLSLGEGRSRVEVYDISTVHAESFLLTYVPSEKLIFSADHFTSQFVTGTPTANKGTIDMLRAIDALELDVAKIATAHSARIFSIKEMRKSVAEFKPVKCTGKRPVCI